MIDPHNPPMHDPRHYETEGHHGDSSHNVGKYIKVFIALCVLTMCSFFTYSEYWWFKDTPSVGWAFMMCVSCGKALLVMLFFMHLKYEADWKYVLTIPATMMSIFLILALVPDIGMRVKGSFGYSYSEARERASAGPEDAEALIKASEAEAARHGDGGHPAPAVAH